MQVETAEPKPNESNDLCNWITRIDNEMKIPCSAKLPKLREEIVQPKMKCQCHGQELESLTGWHLLHDPSGDSYEGEWLEVC